jgi:hypothetical protein
VCSNLSKPSPLRRMFQTQVHVMRNLTDCMLLTHLVGYRRHELSTKWGVCYRMLGIMRPVSSGPMIYGLDRCLPPWMLSLGPR